MKSITDIRNAYHKAGIHTIPLLSNGKEPAIDDWQSKLSEELWADTPSDANIGIRCGGQSGIAAIICENQNDPLKVWKILEFMEVNLRLYWGDYPVVQTASQIGRQIYFRLSNPPEGNVRKLSSRFGSAEIRFGSDSYVVAPLSRINDSGYRFITGNIDSIPEIEFNSLLPLFDEAEASESSQQSQEVSYSDQPVVDFQLAFSVEERRELVRLIHRDASIDAVISHFQEYSSFAGLDDVWRLAPEKAEALIRYTYDFESQMNPWVTQGRQRAMNVIIRTISHSWPGRSGHSDRQVLLAHAQIAGESGKFVYDASIRELSERAGVSKITVARANMRLIKAGLLKRIDRRMTPRKDYQGPLSFSFELILNGLPPVHKDGTYRIPIPLVWPTIVSRQILTHDAFSPQGLGISSLVMYQLLLNNGSLSAKQLAERSGKHMNTVYRALNKLQQAGMAIRTGGLWNAIQVDLDEVAKRQGVAGLSERRKHQHYIEREAFRRSRAIWKAKDERARRQQTPGEISDD